MTREQLIQDARMSDSRYICYHPAIQLNIFCCLIELSDVEECEIYISKELNLLQLLPLMNEYFRWLAGCKDVVIAYFQERTGEKVPEDWFEKIEVYHFSLTFNSNEDFGATISCGESIFCDHTIEFDFEKYQIMNDRLVG